MFSLQRPSQVASSAWNSVRGEGAGPQGEVPDEWVGTAISQGFLCQELHQEPSHSNS